MKIVACLILMLLAAFAPPACAQQRELDDNSYQRYVTALPAADKVEVLLVFVLQPNMWGEFDCEQPDVICKPQSGMPVRVVAAKTLTGEEANKLSLLWRRLKPGNGAGCFSPGYLLRFSAHGQVLLEAEVCFHCHNIALPGEIAGMGGSGEALSRFEEFVTTALPFPKPAASK
jgi:hypothetical protein